MWIFSVKLQVNAFYKSFLKAKEETLNNYELANRETLKWVLSYVANDLTQHINHSSFSISFAPLILSKAINLSSVACTHNSR